LTNLYNTIPNCTKLFNITKIFTTLDKTLQFFTTQCSKLNKIYKTLYTIEHIIYNSTTPSQHCKQLNNIYTHIQHFTQHCSRIYNILQTLNTFSKQIHKCTELDKTLHKSIAHYTTAPKLYTHIYIYNNKHTCTNLYKTIQHITNQYQKKRIQTYITYKTFTTTNQLYNICYKFEQNLANQT
jgi:DNA repair ATPase RecN